MCGADTRNADCAPVGTLDSVNGKLSLDERKETQEKGDTERVSGTSGKLVERCRSKCFKLGGVEAQIVDRKEEDYGERAGPVRVAQLATEKPELQGYYEKTVVGNSRRTIVANGTPVT